MDSFAVILGGHTYENQSDISKIKRNLSKTIDNFSNELLKLDLDKENHRILAPFYARTILEASMTLLISRIDPFRVLTIYKVQSSSKYDVTKKSSVALLWSGDIIAQKTKGDIFDPDVKISDGDRALLGKYWGEMLWVPSLIKLQDYISADAVNSQWLNMFSSEEPSNYFERIKTDAMKMFSFFSKGVHYEFLIDIEHTYDKLTIQSNIYGMFQKILILGLTSHFESSVNHNLKIEDSIKMFVDLEKEIEEWYTRMKP